jgi:hypothetical protein
MVVPAWSVVAPTRAHVHLVTPELFAVLRRARARRAQMVVLVLPMATLSCANVHQVTQELFVLPLLALARLARMMGHVLPVAPPMFARVYQVILG